MFSRHALMRKSLSVILLSCSGWLFVACLVLCSIHTAEKQTHSTRILSNSVFVGQESDCCPITNALPIVVPERRVGAFLMNDDQVELAPFDAPTRRILISNSYTSVSFSGADPPLEPFHSLRI